MRALALCTALATIACIAAASSASAQEPCAQAINHLSDCSAQYCALPNQAADCVQTVTEATAALTAPGRCDGAMAEEILWSSCARLAAGGGSRAGNACIAAMEHIRACMMARCAEDPQHPICDVMDSMMEEVPPCGEAEEEMAAQMLEMSCDDLLGF